MSQYKTPAQKWLGYVSLEQRAIHLKLSLLFNLNFSNLVWVQHSQFLWERKASSRQKTAIC